MVVAAGTSPRRRGERPKPIWVRSLVPKEKNSASFAISSAVRAPRGHLDHGAHQVLDARAVLAQHLLGRLEHDLLLAPQLLHVADERDHDLGLDRDALLRHLQRGLEDGARLHARDLRIGDAEAAAAVAEHGVELVQLLDRAQQLLQLARSPAWFFASPFARSVATCTMSSSRLGRNSCSGGSRVRMVTGWPCISWKRPGEVGALHGQQLLEGARVVGDDLPYSFWTLASSFRISARLRRPCASFEALLQPRVTSSPRWPRAADRIIFTTWGSRSSAKNMCSVRQRPMPRAPKAKATLASRGMSALARIAQPADLVGPAQQLLELLVERRLLRLELALPRPAAPRTGSWAARSGSPRRWSRRWRCGRPR